MGTTDFSRYDGNVRAAIALGEDIAAQLGRIADHLEVESVVSASNRHHFGRLPAGHPANHFADPNIATKDEALVALEKATPVE